MSVRMTQSLKIKCLKVEDLFTDLADGKILMKLLEIISGEYLGKPNKGKLRVQKIENLNRCLNFLHTKVTKLKNKQISVTLNQAKLMIFINTLLGPP